MPPKRDEGKESKRANWTEPATRALVAGRLERHARFEAKGRVAPLWEQIANLDSVKKYFLLNQNFSRLTHALWLIDMVSMHNNAVQNGK